MAISETTKRIVAQLVAQEEQAIARCEKEMAEHDRLYKLKEAEKDNHESRKAALEADIPKPTLVEL